MPAQHRRSRGPTERLSILGEQVRLTREEAGLSQAELARRLRWAQATMSRVELGGSGDLGVERVRSLEEALGLEHGDLLFVAGYAIGAIQKTEAVLLADPALDASLARSLVTYYEALVRTTTTIRGDAPRSRASGRKR